MKTMAINQATVKLIPQAAEFMATHVCDECSDTAIGALGPCDQEPSDGRDCDNCSSLAQDPDDDISPEDWERAENGGLTLSELRNHERMLDEMYP